MNSRRPARALVLMPMLPGFEGVRASVATAVAAAGLQIERLEHLMEDWEWLHWLHTAIRRCDLILADPTRHNAFVMYELGVARARSIPTLLILDETDSQLSGSLDGSAFRLYANDALDDFTDRISTDLCQLAGADCATPASMPEDHHALAVQLLEAFQAQTSLTLEAVDRDAFTVRLSHAMHHGMFLPALAATPVGEAGLLAALVRDSRMVDTMSAIRAWVDQHTRR